MTCLLPIISIFYIGMFKKENVAPVKQGVFYELNLSKNSGPFLSKDIMYNNPRSNNLLTNHAILNEHRKMVETLTQLDKTAKMQHTRDENTENFAAVARLCEVRPAPLSKNWPPASWPRPPSDWSSPASEGTSRASTRRCRE